MRRLLYLFLLLAVVACGSQRLSLGYQPDTAVSVGENSLTTLVAGHNKLHTNAFFRNPQQIDSVSVTSDAFTAELSADKSIIDIYCGEDMPAMGAVDVWIAGHPYSIPCRRSDKVLHNFTYDARGAAVGRVQIAGQMNNWVADNTPDLAIGEDGLYHVQMMLSPGTYLYQLKIDGVQAHDHTNPDRVDNGYGAFNSIMHVMGNEAKFPRIATKEYSGRRVVLSLENRGERVWAFWGNTRLDEHFCSITETSVEVVLPSEAENQEHALLRIWVSNEWGVSNDVYVPLFNGEVVSDPAELAVSDKHRQIIYFLLVDRFRNGDKDNDRPMNRADVNPKADYQGGDLAGVMQKIDSGYFTELGANVLWLSPLNQNPMEPYGYNAAADTKFSGYHGYWPISSSKVDCRFGTNEELKNLVKEAHSRNIRIYLDYVANHVHQDHPLYRSHPDFATPLYLPDGRKNVELWDEQRLTTWFDTFLPTLDYGNPEVVDMMVDSALFWVEEFGIDGFRHDACKHVNEEYWRKLTHRLKEARPDNSFYQIGESYGSPELISSYVNSGMLDGQFDFNVYDEAASAFNGVSGGTLSRLADILRSSLNVYGNHNLMGYISGNHDKPRFMAVASGDIAVGEDAKLAGWKREVGIKDSVAYDRLAVFHTFNGTIPGVPVYYYGDEIGMTGGNDPDCRRMMRFENLNRREQRLLDHVSRLNRLRLENMPLLYGDFRFADVTDSTMVFVRTYFDKETYVVINNSSEAVTFNIKPAHTQVKALFGNRFDADGGGISMTLPAYSSEILY